MKQLNFRALAVLCFLASAAITHADDEEPPLYVAEIGSDSGSCSMASPCGSVGFALQRAGKNGRIFIGPGSYPIADVADLIYLMSGAVDVRSNASDGKTTTLIGVPPEFVAEVQEMGFRVIVDSKGIGSDIVAAQLSLQTNAVATDCVNGFAGNFRCDKLDLLAHVSDRASSARGADIWGFIDLNTHREYAIVGYSTGTAVYDVTDPELPREVGFVNGQQTTWRDIKVYQSFNPNENRWNAYAYVTADSATDGLFIIDLTQLPHAISRIGYSSDFAAAHNVYIADTDFSTGLSVSGDTPLLVLAGSDRSDGRFRTYSLTDPRSPQFIAAPATPAGQPGGDRLYMHDAASMIVTDNRKDLQCINAAGNDHCDVLFDFNESSIDIWDITQPSSPAILSQLPYSNTGYTHSGWPSEDQQFLFVQDELDERDRGLVTTLRVVSIADLRAPTISTAWSGPSNAIDHNGFVRGNRYYMSNYARGFTVLDITNPQNAVEVGHFDTYPASDNVGFPGNWGAYPYLPSGNIALSDIDSGLYLLADHTVESPAGALSFTAVSFAASETESLALTVQRSGGSSGAISVNWEVIFATADTDDIATSSGVLSWADGDSGDRTINIDTVGDGINEGLERLLVRMVAPTGGATVAAPFISSAFISDPGAQTSVSFSTNSVTVAERGFGVAVATLQRSGNAAGSASVDFSITGGDAAAGDDYTGPRLGHNQLG